MRSQAERSTETVSALKNHIKVKLLTNLRTVILDPFKHGNSLQTQVLVVIHENPLSDVSIGMIFIANKFFLPFSSTPDEKCHSNAFHYGKVAPRVSDCFPLLLERYGIKNHKIT